MITMKLIKLTAIPVIGLTLGLGLAACGSSTQWTRRDRHCVARANHARSRDPGRSSTGTARTGQDRVRAGTRSRACAY
jgi:hypothetical protein